MEVERLMDLDAQPDPTPPVGGSSELDSVAVRARLRRRRNALSGLVVVVALAVVTGLVVAGRSEQALILQPDTTLDGSTTSVPPSTSTDESVTTVTTVTPVTTVDPTPHPDRIGMVVGIDTNGDAILIRPGAEPVVLFDGPEPGSVAVEGDLDFVDHVALSPDGRRAVVSSCCEPGSGSFFVVDTETLEVVGSGLGHLAEFTSYGDLVVASMDGISLIDGETLAPITDLVSVSMNPTSWFFDLAVIGETVYALSAGFGGGAGDSTSRPVTLHSLQVAGGDMLVSVELERVGPISDSANEPGADSYLVGSTIWLFVVDSTGALRAFDMDTFQEVDAAGQFGSTPLWVGHQVFAVTSGADGTVLGFEDTFQTFPDLHLTFARS
jgi:hypothetical protein